jgi:serralysin
MANFNGTSADDNFTGGPDSDTAVGRSGNDTLAGGDGNDVLYGDEQTTFSFAGDGNDSLSGDAGNDYVVGGGGDDDLQGGADNDNLYGGAGRDTLNGGAGDDFLAGDQDADVLIGGDGNDQFSAGYGDSVDGGPGIDLLALSFFGETTSGVSADLRQLANNGTVVIDGATLTGIEYVIYLSLTEFDDDVIAGPVPPGPEGIQINAWGGNDRVTGSAGTDLISGGDGDDELHGGFGFNPDVVPGTDRLFGEAGNDTIYIDGPDGANASGGLGNDRIFGGAGYDEIRGDDGNDILSGGSGPDGIQGGAGNDILDGGSGNDTLIGGAGDDVYAVDSSGDVIFDDNGGNDRVLASVSYLLGANPQVDLLSAADQNGTAPLDLAGSNFSQVIIGNEGTNNLEGLGGNDQLWGLGGNDTLDGGSGADVLIGGAGDDIYTVDSLSDAIFEQFGEGNDRVLSVASYALGAAAEVELVSSFNQSALATTRLTGNDFGQAILGNNGANTLEGLGGTDALWGLAGNDILDGGAGNDFARGGSGDDTYAVDSALDQIFETAGEGSDRVYASASFALAGGAEVELVSVYNQLSVDAIDLTGNEFGQVLFGNETGNRLSGGGGNDTLWGLGRDDTLDGGSGTDALVGGNGADLFRFTAAVTADNADTIFGYVAADDTIQLDDAVFTGLALGTLNANAFVTGTAAQDADDRILYDSATGNLFFDADGNGSGAAVQFATLQGAPAITASEFVVV